MKILAFGASSSSTSINQQFACFTASAIADSFTAVSLKDFDCPLYSADEEAANGIPENALQFLGLINEADLLIISFAEHNGSYTAAYKNLFDWMSRHQQKVFSEKRVVLLATSPGPGGAQNVLKQAEASMPFFGASVLASFSLPSFYTSFSAEAFKLVTDEHFQRFDVFTTSVIEQL
ncbi:NADPH-dependent FMN reductase [Umboniibacter marinipuniceus]|uniref:NAD(P)H-dependent FMN reductase n=1 Tax=Umboniibacter marinipuniceus TaxID=569599 RepID=A0A3M0ABF1_9GAMM|nr:NADPH-dependent FMN reductase [Umboniibacter marinipuniceus]RMA82493.1 NAD(P)H-dependent FMN reductase [Umboniibacter marinipuniceus]